MLSLMFAWFGIFDITSANSPICPFDGGPWGWQQLDSSRQLWNLERLTTLVAFGDSYTDHYRLEYFKSHNNTPPPAGWVAPENYDASTGRRTWVEYVKQYTGANLYNYAVGGAECSDSITPRTVWYATNTTRFNFPTFSEYEIPAYMMDSEHIQPDGTRFLTAPKHETVYAIWIGVNDLGMKAILTDSQVPGTNIVDYTDCVFDQLQRLYVIGARYFVLLNVAPLDLTPLYGLPGKGGKIVSRYWPDKPSNTTEISCRMMEQVATVNAIYRYQTPFVVEVGTSFKDARFAVFNVNGLITNIYNNPSAYLNGSAPLNVTGAVHDCNANSCITSDSPDSYLWYDDLHPSEQTGRVVAQEFVKVIRGESQYATYWG